MSFAGRQRHAEWKRDRGNRRCAEHLDDLIPNRIDAQTQFAEDRRSRAAILSEQPEEQVLGSNVTVQQPVGFLRGVTQGANGFLAERHFARLRQRRKLRRAGVHQSTNVLAREAGAREHTHRHRLLVAKQCEQHVLGFNLGAAPLEGLVSCEEECASRLLCVTLEHDADDDEL